MSVNYTALLISFSIIKGLAVVLTLFRLGFRLKIQRFWWEDMWAAVALLCTVISTIISALTASGSTNYEPTLIAARINGFMFTSIVWSVRMSLIFSVVRITPSPFLRRITLAVAACLFLFWAATLSLQAWWCDNTPTLPGEGSLGCVLPRFIIIFEMTVNCGSDTLTVIFPLKLLWRVKLPQRQRRMLLSLFSANRFLCIASLAHLLAQWVGVQSVQDVLANLQLAVFLITCNLLVVVTYVYRVFKSPPDEDLSSGSDDTLDDDDFTTPATRSIQDLTTVDLDSPITSVTEVSSELKSADFFPSTSPTIINDPERLNSQTNRERAVREIRTWAS